MPENLETLKFKQPNTMELQGFISFVWLEKNGGRIFSLWDLQKVQIHKSRRSQEKSNKSGQPK